MEIVLAKTAGFCFGVQNAINTALSAKGKIVTLGDIIHNELVVNNLKEKGIYPINSLEDYVDGKIVIRSHGVGKKMYEQMQERGIEYIDATCPFVKKIHNIVRNAFEQGKQVIITGEEKHAEVIGINGWCEGSAIIIDSEKEAEELDFVDKECVLVSQTTFSAEKFKNIKKIIKNKCKIVEIFDTICYTTRDRQQEVVEIAKNVDIMLVIGGNHSSNTLKLFNLAKQYCKQSYLITCIDDLSKVVKQNARIGVTAGASTPKELIMEVIGIMSDTQGKSKEMLNEEVAVNANNEENNLFVSVVNAESAYDRPQAGKKKRVTVVSANKDGIIVHYGTKTEAFIDKSEVELDEKDYNPDNYQEGTEFEAVFVANKGKGEMIAMSKKIILQKELEDKKVQEIINGNEFTIKIDKAVKDAGLLSKLGSYTIFVPQSQIRIGFEKNLEKYVGKELRVRKIEAKNGDKVSGKKIIASHKVIAEEEKKAKEDAFWNLMIPNTIVKGVVKRFAKFGAFVSVNKNDCLAHISDLSWTKVEDPAEVLEINKTYEFLILDANRETGKVSLGYKQLQKKPYEEAQDKYPVGSVVKGVVERIFAYGAFVSIDKGIDGLVPVSEISYNFVKDANEAFKVGQEIEAKVIKFEGSKITLSVKALLDPPAPVEKEVEITQDDIKENNEKRAKANAKKFENATAQNKKPRAKKVATAPVQEEVKSWTSESVSATMADLFKDLNLSFDNKDAE